MIVGLKRELQLADVRMLIPEGTRCLTLSGGERHRHRPAIAPRYSS